MDWQWIDQPGHFCNSSKCHFWIHTHVGPAVETEDGSHQFCVSTVGDYRPFAAPYTPTSDEMVEMGIAPNSYYETMVFDLTRVEGGLVIDEWTFTPGRWSELLRAYSATEDEARATHLRACQQYDTAKPPLIGAHLSERDES